MNFLIVDDDETFNLLLCRNLIKRGYEAHSAHNISTALKLLDDNPITHCVVDLKIDQESGLELLQKLLAKSPQLKIVLLTGYSSIATAVDAIKLGAINYLCKPSSLEDILGAFNHQENEASPTKVNDQPHSVERLEWEHIQRVLAENEGNISATARALGMHRRTLQRKLQKRPVKQ
ncbi:MAG: response regulator transcription factor [Cellvibrionaceae bacterium]